MSAKNLQSNLPGAAITWIKAIDEWTEEERQEVYERRRKGETWMPRWRGIVRSVYLLEDGPAYTVQAKSNELREVNRVLEPRVEPSEPEWFGDPAALEGMAQLLDGSHLTEGFARDLRAHAERIRKGGKQ